MTMELPRLYFVRQNFPDRSLADVSGEVRKQLAASPFAARLKPGARVAIGVGSRGIHNIATIARAIADYWRSQGMRPFIFPAMGSHGAATAEGQADVLAHYGIVEETMGCPIVSSLEVVPLGKTPEGIETFMDRNAYESDGVMLVGRVKWHTDFAGKIESGLFKMMAIGLGKFSGAQHYHTYAYKLGLENVIRSIGRQVLKSGRILGGLAILEDAYHNTAKLDAVPVEVMEQREEENLALVKSWMGKIPMDLDILILDQIGKNISGAGMDTKVVNRSVHGAYNPWPDAPKIERIFVRDLSDLSYNNAVGLGMADVVTDRLVNRIDWVPTRINSLTASTPAAIRTPVHFPTDRQCLEAMAPTVGKFDTRQVTIGWIRNTMELTPILLSENLRPQIEQNPLLEMIGPASEIEFDAGGNLVDRLSAAEPAVPALQHS
ncbi:MAG TPA: lactate racemase domain-containing protein [Bryobacteraceae bacterium]|nr:lactate racemase domain-containing protein [Bryobacteraceae bacterium]